MRFKLDKNLAKDFLGLLICLVFLWWAVSPLFRPGLFPTIDNISVVRLEEMARELKNNQFPVRHMAELGRRRGYLLFNFYGPLPFYFGALLHLIGINLVGALKRTFLMAFILAAVSMYLWAKKFFGRLGGIIAAIFFVFSPYFGFDVYTRGGLGEVWALALLPLTFWSFSSLATEKRYLYFFLSSLSLFALLVSHNLTAFVALPFLAIFLILAGYQYQEVKRLALAFGLGFGLAAFFLIPLLVEKGMLWLNFTSQNVIEYQRHFLSLETFLLPSFPQMKFNIFYTLIPFLAIGLAFVKRRKESLFNKTLVFSFLAFLFSIFMSLSFSLPAWNLLAPFLSILQFPWRFVVMATFFASFLAGAIVSFFVKKHWQILFFFILLFLPLVVNLSANFRPKTYEFIDKYRAEDPCGTTWDFEYFPTWIKACLKKEPNLEMEVISGGAQLEEIQVKPRFYQARLKGGQGRIRINEYYYPGWTVWVDEKRTPIDYNNWYGLIEFSVPKESQMVKAQLLDTPTRKISNLISLGSLLFLLIWPLVPGKRRLLR